MSFDYCHEATLGRTKLLRTLTLISSCQIALHTNVKVLAIDRIFIERPARTNALLSAAADVEDNICSLINYVKPETEAD
jgi:hypothetical protein